jgi:type IV pilus assembly protein PilW
MSAITMKSHSSRQQTGFSLVELMIGMAIGLIIVAAAATVYVTTVRGGADTLRSAKLNIELRGAMDIMVAEIRRAGYLWFDADTDLSTNPFMQANTNLTLVGSDCLLFAYDANGNNVADTSDQFGFKKNGSKVSMRLGGTAPSTSAGCSATGDSWESITDDNSIIVDTLTFAVTYQCLNSKTGAGSANQACATGNAIYNAASAAAVKSDLVEIRNVAITIVGHHKDDTQTRMSLSQSVRVRNDRIQTVP